jgi:tRNA (guanine26-N2/guanine27-N2)-dimethyltransferase
VAVLQDALANFGAVTRSTPSSNEQALRVLAGAACLQGAARGLHVTPLFSVFAHHGMPCL